MVPKYNVNLTSVADFGGRTLEMPVLALFRNSFQIHKVASDVAADVTLNMRKAKRETFTMCFKRRGTVAQITAAYAP